jgi:HSP20 family molecular chaperone IbpA
MSTVTICNAQADGGLKSAVARIMDRVRTRAYELFEHRGRMDGHSLDDWLAAESELLYHPQIELTETDEDLHFAVDVAGFKSEELHVDVLPASVIIIGEHERHGKRHHEEETRALVAEMDLPCAIDPNHVDAKLRRHILEIVARKARQSTEEPIWVAQ